MRSHLLPRLFSALLGLGLAMAASTDRRPVAQPDVDGNGPDKHGHAVAQAVTCSNEHADSSTVGHGDCNRKTIHDADNRTYRLGWSRHEHRGGGTYQCGTSRPGGSPRGHPPAEVRHAPRTSSRPGPGLRLRAATNWLTRIRVRRGKYRVPGSRQGTVDRRYSDDGRPWRSRRRDRHCHRVRAK